MRSDIAITAYRAAKAIPLAGETPARGIAALDAPPVFIEDAVLVCNRDNILAVEPYASFRRGGFASAPLHDFGNMCLVPGFVNAHCHLELSHLGGKTVKGQGFAAWMRSLIPLAARPVSKEQLLSAVRTALRRLSASGAVHVGDVGSRTPGLVAKAVADTAMDLARRGRPYAGMSLVHFLEVFGYSLPQADGERLPKALREVGYVPSSAEQLAGMDAEYALAGHALYSTSPKALQAAHAWCLQHGRTYSLHLAESEDEEACLRDGKGEFAELLRVRVLPESWRPPGLGSVACADSLGLLDENTMAVHAVHCSADDIALLSAKGCRVCLCPRSNEYIGVGRASAREMAAAGISLCLGTDSLASNDELDMMAEMAAAQAAWGFSPAAVLRMASSNGAYSLGAAALGALEPGKAARFALIPPDFFA